MIIALVSSVTEAYRLPTTDSLPTAYYLATFSFFLPLTTQITSTRSELVAIEINYNYALITHTIDTHNINQLSERCLAVVVAVFLSKPLLFPFRAYLFTTLSPCRTHHHTTLTHSYHPLHCLLLHPLSSHPPLPPPPLSLPPPPVSPLLFTIMQILPAACRLAARR